MLSGWDWMHHNSSGEQRKHTDCCGTEGSGRTSHRQTFDLPVIWYIYMVQVAVSLSLVLLLVQTSLFRQTFTPTESAQLLLCASTT